MMFVAFSGRHNSGGQIKSMAGLLCLDVANINANRCLMNIGRLNCKMTHLTSIYVFIK